MQTFVQKLENQVFKVLKPLCIFSKLCSLETQGFYYHLELGLPNLIRNFTEVQVRMERLKDCIV